MKSQTPRSVMPPVPGTNVVEREVRAALHRSKDDVTVADLVAVTGIPGHCIEGALSRLSVELACSRSVTESGEVLYRFDDSMRPVEGGRPALVRVLNGIGDAAVAAVRGIAKRLPLVCMSGYFVFFLTFPFPPALILLALLISYWSDTDLLDFYGSPHPRGSNRLQSPRSLLQEYLRGPAAVGHDGPGRELRLALATVRSESGIISLADVLALTGLSPQKAQEYLDAFLVRFTGEPTVTGSGRIVYRFPDLLKTGNRTGSTSMHSQNEARDCGADVAEDSGRKHGIIALINLSNLLFSIYYGTLSLRAIIGGNSVQSGSHQLHPGISVLFNAIYSLASGAHVAFALPTVLFGLGVIPFGMSTAFFVVHCLTMFRRSVERREAANRRLRRAVYAQVLANPDSVAPNSIRVPSGTGRGRYAGKAVAKIIDELAVLYDAEIENDGEGHFIYHFPELEAEGSELAGLRRSVERTATDVGQVVFDPREPVK